MSLAGDPFNRIIWRPNETEVRESNVWRFMSRHGLSSYEDLLIKSTSDIGWFWDAVMKDLRIFWDQPYQRVYDTSQGIPWTRWFVGGKLNLVRNCLDRHGAEQPGAVACVWEGEEGAIRTINYGDLCQQSNRLANGLASLGIGKGDTVGIYLPMSLEMISAFYAILRIGAVAVPIFSGFAPEAVATRLRQAEAKVLFTADGSLRRGRVIGIKEAADRASEDVPTLQHRIVVKHLNIPVPWDQEKDISYCDLIEQESTHFETLALDPEDPGLLLFTSGTTGPPKGTLHTHAGSIAQIGKELAYHFDFKPSDRFFWLTDIGWMMGPWSIIGAHLLGGSVLIFDGAPNQPRPDRLWDLVDRHRVTHLGISPTLIRMLRRQGDDWVSHHDLSSLRILGSSGEPWDPESYMWFFERIGKSKLPIINISGGTEIIGCFLAPLPIHPLKPCTLQGPGLGMDIDVFDDDGLPVRGRMGHLVCKQPAPSMTRGLWKDRERYLKSYWSRWENVWFHGDWAMIDEEGYWSLHGRSDDTMKISGRRTGPAEIESALLQHPAATEAAAIGVPDEITGEAIIAFVILRPGSAPNDTLRHALIDEVVQRLGKSFRPRAIYFVPDLPKTRSAKIVRRVIKAKYLGNPLGELSSIENPAAIEEIKPMGRILPEDTATPPQGGTLGRRGSA